VLAYELLVRNPRVARCLRHKEQVEALHRVHRLIRGGGAGDAVEPHEQLFDECGDHWRLGFCLGAWDRDDLTGGRLSPVAPLRSVANGAKQRQIALLLIERHR